MFLRMREKLEEGTPLRERERGYQDMILRDPLRETLHLHKTRTIDGKVLHFLECLLVIQSNFV